MSFGRPEYLHILWALPLLAITLSVAGRRLRAARLLLMSERLFDKLARGLDPSAERRAVFLFLLAFAALGFALARPQVGFELAEVKRRGLDVMVALDTSRSMLAEDLRPNRLEAAKRETERLFDLLRGNRVGLMTFAGESFTNCPLTLDGSAATLFLSGVGAGSIPVPGSNLEKAIRRAMSAFPGEERRFKVMVLLTDGEGHEGDALRAAREAADEGVVIFTIGIGSDEGTTVPLRDPETGQVQENLRDRSGRPVFSRLDRATLQKIAAITGGAYYESGGGALDLMHLRDTITAMETRELTGRQTRLPIERFQWPLLLAIIALSLEMALPRGRRKERVWTV